MRTQAAADHVIMQTVNHVVVHIFRYLSHSAYLRGSNRTAKNHKQKCAKLDTISSAQSGKLDSRHAKRVEMHLQYCIYIYIYTYTVHPSPVLRTLPNCARIMYMHLYVHSLNNYGPAAPTH